MSEYPNRVPLETTLERINRAPLQEYKVEVPGPAGDEYREPKNTKK